MSSLVRLSENYHDYEVYIFCDGNANNIPSLSIGKKFGSCPDMAKCLLKTSAAISTEDAAMKGANSPKPTSSKLYGECSVDCTC